MTTLLSPRTPEEVDSAVADGAVPIAGGTDLLVAVRSGLAVPAMVDLNGLASRSIPIRRRQGSVILSAVAPIAAIAGALDYDLPGMRSAIAAFASPQIRNRATVGGNLATASPAGDLQPVIAVADGTVVVRGLGGRRRLPVGDFLLGPRRTALHPGEWIEEVQLDTPTGVDGFRKIGGRRALAISLVSLAWRWRIDDDGRLQDVRIAVGSSAPTVIRCTRCEAVLAGAIPTAAVLGQATSAMVSDIAPIDDLRASAGYRRRAVAGLLAEAIGEPAAREWNVSLRKGLSA